MEAIMRIITARVVMPKFFFFIALDDNLSC